MVLHSKFDDHRLIYGSLEDGGSTRLLPRFKFNFKLSILIDDTTIIFERVKTVSLPDITYDTQIANQYNIKRVIQKKKNYGTCTIAFYDTYDNAFMQIMERYNKRYYNKNSGLQYFGPKGGDLLKTPYSNSVTVDDFSIDDNFGYTLTSDETKYFFEKITILQFSGNDGDINRERKTILHHPIITSFAVDILDYSDSQPALFTVTFQPEYVTISPSSETIQERQAIQ